MTTTKSYLAGLGMTGIVIGSVLVLLAVGTGLVAFDGARDVGGGRAPLERVVVGEGADSAGAERASKRPDVQPAPATAALPAAAPPVTSQPSAPRVRGPRVARGRDSGRRAGHGHGGAQVHTSNRLGGGAAVKDASQNGGGAAADSPPGRARGRADTPPGRARGRAPSSVRGLLSGRVGGRSLGIGHGRAPSGS